METKIKKMKELNTLIMEYKINLETKIFIKTANLNNKILIDADKLNNASNQKQ